MEAHISDIVISQSGRDRGFPLLVVAEDETFVFLANGKNRRFERPKRKKRKHAAFAARCDEWTRNKLETTGKLTNGDIRKALALWAGESIDSN